MKKIYSKLFLILSVLSVTFFISSCKNDLKDVKYTPDNNNVTFAKPSQNITLDGKGDIIVELVRGVAKEAISVSCPISRY